MDRIQQAGRPEVVDKKWLASNGFKSTSDASIIPLLKFIGFIDHSGKPMDRWVQYRDRDRAPLVLGQAIEEAYSDLFQVFPDAPQRSAEELANFFRSRSKAGEQAISKMVSSFKALCNLGALRSTPATGADVPCSTDKAGTTPATPELTRRSPAGITININLQLTLPETTDETVYDKLFASLRRHLFEGDGRA